MKRLALLSSLVLGLGLAAIGCKTAAPADPTPAPTTGEPTTGEPTTGEPTTPQPGEGEATFTATIASIDFGCRSDASCDVMLDGNRKVHFGHDTRRQGPTEWGDHDTLWPLADAADKGAGKKVEVFAKVTGEGTYTLEGNKAYYVRVVE